MGDAAKKILEEALSLPQEEREELLGALSDSLAPVEVSEAWRDEIARRLERIASGRAEMQDAGEHLQALRAKYPR